MKNKKVCLIIGALLLLMSGVLSAQENQVQNRTYQPTVQSLDQHQVPDWYQDAKLGIFIHWGLYSVPAWAPTDIQLHQASMEQFFQNNPYAEWYLNSMRIDGSATQKHHYDTYGKDFNYYDFAKTFNQEIQKWDPQEMADLFKAAHARYVVLTTKHHEGFTLWPSRIGNPYLPFDEQHASRDLVGELADAVRGDGMRMGLYYSGGIDWSFNPIVISGMNVWNLVTPQTDQYAQYADAQWRELIRRYKPAILWNDINYPDKGETLQIFAEYYNQIPDGVINNRWNVSVHDITTPEYAQYDQITPEKWESCRGIDLSFGYNQNSTAKQMLSVDELVDSFVDIVSKNGNLLLDVGPKADGTIPEAQVERLQGLGNWLSMNGEAIFGSRPWVHPEETTDDGVDVRFTRQEDSGYAILLQEPKNRRITLHTVYAGDGTVITLLGADGELSWKQQGKNLTITLPRQLPGEHAYTLKMTPAPWRVVKE